MLPNSRRDPENEDHAQHRAQAHGNALEKRMIPPFVFMWVITRHKDSYVRPSETSDSVVHREESSEKGDWADCNDQPIEEPRSR